jgi:uncharacterized Zn-binding protein involved in type VI secretion
MPKAVAKKGDRITATDTHLVIPASGGPPVPTPLPYNGVLQQDLCTSVFSQQQAVAVVGSTSVMSPGHIVAPNSFANPPSNEGHVFIASQTVYAEHKAVARDGDVAKTCNDPTDLPVGTVVASGSVYAG